MCVQNPQWYESPVILPTAESRRRLIPDLEEAVPRASAYRHTIFTYTKAADTIVMTRQYTCKSFAYLTRGFTLFKPGIAPWTILNYYGVM